LIIKILRTSVTTMGEVNGEYIMKDYKAMDGVVMPMTLVQKAAGQEIVVKFESVKPNVKLPKDRFSPPAK